MEGRAKPFAFHEPCERQPHAARSRSVRILWFEGLCYFTAHFLHFLQKRTQLKGLARNPSCAWGARKNFFVTKTFVLLHRTWLKWVHTQGRLQRQASLVREPGFYATDPQCCIRSVPCPGSSADGNRGAPSLCSVPWTSRFQQQETCPQPPTRWGPDSSLPPQLYESALTENQKLKTKLQEAQLELADVKSKLEKMAQVRRGEENQAWVRQRGGQDGPPQR